ncbi:hypothetical protein FPZ41_30220, partial [Streptomyces sp. K1PN6]|nr:hypothetical protein [Streptomyces acidicola]
MRRLSGEKPVISRILRPSLRLSLRSSRARRGAALAVLCALTLAACGTERAGDEDTKAGRDDRVGAGSPTASRAGGGDADSGDADSGDAEFLAFMELLTSLAKPCLKDVPVPEPPEEPEPDTAGPPTAALPEPS